MAYYFRVFCNAATVPPLSDVLGWVRERGVNLHVAPGGVEAWEDDPVTLVYEEGVPPFLAELNRNDGEDSLAAQEIGEFISMLEEEAQKPRKRKEIIQHLRETKFLVACEIPVEKFSDAGFHALDVFLAYFVVHSNGMVQADGQGFYDRGKLIYELAA